MAPGIIGPGTTAYTAAHNQIRAHARAYRAYEADFAATQGGKVGITLNVNWCEPRDPSDQADITASDTCMNFNLGWYAHAIFVDGKYPEVSLCVDALSSNHLSPIISKQQSGDETEN